MTGKQYLLLHSNGVWETVNADWGSNRTGDPFFVFGVGSGGNGTAYPFYWVPIEDVGGVREVTGLDQDAIELVKKIMKRREVVEAPKLPTPVGADE